MKSAGNDIVALNAVDQQRTVSPQFYSKFIIPAELELYEQSSISRTVSFCSFVWLLWSVKEASYKFFKRLQPDLIFSPSKFVIEGTKYSNNDYLQGAVTFQEVQVFFVSHLNEQYISTIVDDQETFQGVHHAVERIDKTDSQSQSDSVRKLALKELGTFLAIDDLAISKGEASYPIIMSRNQQLDIPLSFAHHDCFVGYSFKL